ncbi:MAG: RsmE family RNA methyltransferase [bacterium]|nr:RsmE family RNA methyltransferase [bacterium]
MQLFYYPNLQEQESFSFGEEESKHCIKVLRKKNGDQLQLIDGKGFEAKAIITQDHPKKCSGLIKQRIQHKPARNYYVHLAIAPTKNLDRIEWMLEKAIEIGLDEITFLQCQNSERVKLNLERFHKIAISAIKQSKQYYLPIINPLVSFQDFVEKSALVQTKFIAWCPTEDTQTLFKQIPLNRPSNHILLVGPEGDFTSDEVMLAQTKGYIPCTLGKNILRSETAGLFGISLFAAKHLG